MKKRVYLSKAFAIKESVADLASKDLTSAEMLRIVRASYCCENVGAERKVEEAVGRSLNGFAMSVALALFWKQVPSGLRMFNDGSWKGQLKESKAIFIDVSRFLKRRNAYRSAMNDDGWFNKSLLARGNTTATFFAKHTTELHYASLVWKIWFALAGRVHVAESQYNIDPNKIEAALIQGSKIWRRGEYWRIAVRLIQSQGMYRARIMMARPGKIGNIIDALRAWKWCPSLPKKIAEKIGCLEPWQRVAARVAWEQTPQDPSRAVVKARFWIEFYKVVIQQGPDVIIEQGLYRMAAVLQFHGADWILVKSVSDSILNAIPPMGSGFESRLRQRQDAARIIMSGEIPIAHFCAARDDVRNRLGKKQEQYCDYVTLRLVLVFGKHWSKWLQHVECKDMDLRFWCNFLPITPSSMELREYLLRNIPNLTWSKLIDVVRLWEYAEMDQMLTPKELIWKGREIRLTQTPNQNTNQNTLAF